MCPAWSGPSPTRCGRDAGGRGLLRGPASVSRTIGRTKSASKSFDLHDCWQIVHLSGPNERVRCKICQKDRKWTDLLADVVRTGCGMRIGFTVGLTDWANLYLEGTPGAPEEFGRAFV